MLFNGLKDEHCYLAILCIVLLTHVGGKLSGSNTSNKEGNKTIAKLWNKVCSKVDGFFYFPLIMFLKYSEYCVTSVFHSASTSKAYQQEHQ